MEISCSSARATTELEMCKALNFLTSFPNNLILGATFIEGNQISIKCIRYLMVIFFSDSVSTQHYSKPFSHKLIEAASEA